MQNKIKISAKCADGEWSNSQEFLFVQGIETDSRKDCKGKMFLALEGENFDGHNFIDLAIKNGAVAICANKSHKGIYNIPILYVKDSLEAYQNLANAHRKSLSAQVIGITGSCGKTSSKDILKSILSSIFGENAICATIANTNNHIGVPQNLLRLTKAHKYAIIEMGTNHPGEIEILSKIAEPDIAMISSIGHSHIENFGTVENIAKEKLSIMKYANKNVKLFLPWNCKKYISNENIVTFGEDSHSDWKMEYIKSDIESSEFKVNNHKALWHIPGKHQALNATCAIAICAELGIDIDVIIPFLKDIEISGMRMKIETINGIKWINDAYNANPESMRAAIDWFAEFSNGENITMILGDMLELGEKSEEYHKEILDYLQKKLPKSQIFTVGKMMRKANQSINNFIDSELAGLELKKLLKKNSIVFLKASRGIKLEKIIK